MQRADTCFALYTRGRAALDTVQSAPYCALLRQRHQSRTHKKRQVIACVCPAMMPYVPFREKDHAERPLCYKMSKYRREHVNSDAAENNARSRRTNTQRSGTYQDSTIESSYDAGNSRGAHVSKRYGQRNVRAWHAATANGAEPCALFIKVIAAKSSSVDCTCAILRQRAPLDTRASKAIARRLVCRATEKTPLTGL